MIDYLTLGKYIDPIGVRNQAVRIITDQGVNYRSRWLMMAALHHWVRSQIHIVDGPVGIDYIAPAKDTLELRGGGILDLNILTCSLCEAVGIPSKLMIIDQPSAFYPMAFGLLGEKAPDTVAQDLGNFYSRFQVNPRDTDVSIYNIPPKVYLPLDPQADIAGNLKEAENSGFARNLGAATELIGTLHLVSYN